MNCTNLLPSLHTNLEHLNGKGKVHFISAAGRVANVHHYTVTKPFSILFMISDIIHPFSRSTTVLASVQSKGELILLLHGIVIQQRIPSMQ